MRTKTLAIPIRRTDFSDTSQVISLLTREEGVVDAIAKGAYREKNSFQGPFDLATLCHVVLMTRGPGSGLAVLGEAVQLDGFRGVRQRWSRHVAASWILEFLRTVGTSCEPARELFDLAWRSLRAIDRAADDARLTDVLCGFEIAAFRILGLSAEIAACSECGRPWLREDRPVFFAVDLGGILCHRCRGREPGRAGRVVPGLAVRRLNDLARLPAPEPAGSGAPLAVPRSEIAVDLDAATRSALRGILGGLRQHVLDRPPRMLRYVDRLL